MVSRPLKNLFTIVAVLCGACIVMPITTSAQEFYTPMIHSLMYTPLQGDDPHLQNLNPATTNTTGLKLGGYGLRNFRTTTFTDNDDSKTVTRASVKEEAYGAGALVDLGAGTAAGLNTDRAFTEADLFNSNSNNKPRELVSQQSLMGRVQIEVATGLRLGFALRYVSLNGDILGNFNSNNNRERVRYHGNLVGNGGGLQYTSGGLRLGSAYYPSSRGKSEILFEERIISDPGMALIDGSFANGPFTFGLGIQRWIHRRDERAVSVSSLDQQRTLRLDGLDWEKHVFPISAYHLGVEWKQQPNFGLRFSIIKKDSVFISDRHTAPTTVSGYDSTSELDYHIGVRYIYGIYDGILGASSWSRAKTLTNQSGEAGAIYVGKGSLMYFSIGSRL